MSDFDPTTNPNYNPPGGDGDGNGGGLGNGQGSGPSDSDVSNPPGGDGDGNGGGLGDGNGMNTNGAGNGTDPADPNYNPPGGDGDGNGNGEGNGEGNEGAGDGSNPPGGDGDGNGGGLGDGNGMNTNGAGNISEGGGNTDYLPADGSILLLTEQIGMIDANVYLFKNTEDGVSLERLNKADPSVANEYVGSRGIYELTNSGYAELIQQISAANGSDNHLVYEEAIIVAGNTDDGTGTELTASIDKWQPGNLTSSWLDGPSIKLHRKDEAATETITHVVTVAAGDNVYGSGNKYFIDGFVSPSLDLVSGKTYEFDLSGVPGSHPFEFSTSPNGTFGEGTVYQDVTRTGDKLMITIDDDTPELHYFCANHSGMGGSSSIIDNSIELMDKHDSPGHKHKPDMDKGEYELRVEHDQQTDGAIDMEDVEGVLLLSRGKSSPTGKEHKLAADWNGDGIIDIDDVMGVLARSRGKSKEDEWRFHDKTSDTSLWDQSSKTNKMDITLEENEDIELTAILRGDVNASYNADQHNRSSANDGNGSGTGGGGGNGSGAGDGSGGGKAALTPNYALLPINNDDELQNLHLDIV